MKNFLFHRVNPQRDDLWDPMDPVLFERCIKFIKRKYNTVLLEEYLLNQEDYSNHKNIATILFDDGYLDNYEYALPVLEKYNIKASFYVVTDCIDKNIPTWTHELEHLFQNTKNRVLNLKFGFLPTELQTLSAEKQEDLLSFAKELKPFLKTINHTERNEVLSEIKLQFDDVEFPKIMMNWDHLKKLSKLGHHIGSHTVSHAMLGTVSNESFIKKELVDSRQRILDKLEKDPISISYPVGSYNQIVQKLSKESGYMLGLVVNQDEYIPERNNLFEIQRIELYNESWWKTKLRITNRLEKIKKIIRYR
ncbi:MAG: polysaccharide deacetylase family protein [Bacteroidota bacterium]